MAANRTLTTLSIALIVFVMLTFMLAVTTYLFFKQKFDAEDAAQKGAEKQLQAENELREMTKSFDRLRDIIGTEKDTADTIEAEQNEWLATRFSAFQEENKSYRSLIDWLEKKRADANIETANLVARNEKLTTDTERAVKQAADEKSAAEQARDAAQEAQKKDADDFASRRGEHEKNLEGVVAEQKKALAQSEQTQAIVEELRKIGPLLSPEARRRYETAPADTNEPEPWPERVRLVLRELTDREKAIRDLNTQLSNLRIADGMVLANTVRPGDPLQRAVASSLPLDERIEGFDGRIVDVDERDRTVLISLPTTAGLRPGLLLAVYGQDDPRPQVGERKAMVQITAVENATLARAAIREDDLDRMILPGDGVATSLWRPGEAPEIVIVGFLDLGNGLKQSTAAIKALVERSGATLSDTVTPRTAAVVDAGPPQAADAAAGRAVAWRPADETRRKTTVDRAKAIGVRVIGIDALYDLLGIDRTTAGRPAAAAVAY
jgi:chemotaxis protein histidine kinase CheA